MKKIKHDGAARKAASGPVRGPSRKRPGRPAAASAFFPVVGIGASAGGLEAFTKLLEHLPADTGMAIVVVQHLDPKRESLLQEILSRSTSMPVFEARNRMVVEPNTIYVAPSNAELGFSGGRFALEPRPKVRGQDLGIDHLFRSLAEQFKTRAIGVVLSGTMSDGARGLLAIKAEGGLTFAQDDASAKFHDMPRAAVAAGAVDFVLPPKGIAGELARISKHPHARPVKPPDPSERSLDGTPRILAIVRNTTGVDFGNYRQTTVKRRIARRMALRRVENIEKYTALLRKDPAEVRALHEDILITVTSFFRDPKIFAKLQESVFPAMLRQRSSNNPVRVWVPGCSTGEEAYSIAIALFETMQDMNVQPPIQIFATDVSETAIEKARAGFYLDGVMTDVSGDRLKRFFSKSVGGWQISKKIRDACVFARQNIASDPPFSNLDFISCRNLLIYLEPVLQKRVIPLFHYALRPNGYLFLGNAETLTGYGDLFAPVSRAQHLFVKRPGNGRSTLDFHRRAVPTEEAEPPRAAPAGERPIDLQREVDRILIGRYGPPGVLVDDRYEIVQFRGKTSAYLEGASGAASLNLLKMAREGLLVELRAALLKAKKTKRAVRFEGLRVRRNGHFHVVNIEVVPVRGNGDGRHYLVTFEEAAPRRRREVRSKSTASSAGGKNHDAIARLEQELTATKDYLQATIEEQEASNEELKSANEEILSSNEELQSTNEELETAKEELQSTNEELTTVNEELQNRNSELTQSNNDLVNILAGTNLPIVMLDPQLRLRRFTPLAEKLLNLIPSDLGRRIGDLKPNLAMSDLGEILSDVVDNVVSREREVQDEKGRWYLMRARPYRTMDNRIEGAVIVFFDIDVAKRSLELVNRARDYAESLVETVREGLIVLDGSFQVRAANRSFHRLFGTTAPQIEGKPFLEVWHFGSADPPLGPLLERTARSGDAIEDQELRVDGREGGERVLRLSGRPVRLAEESEPLTLLAIDDITARTRAEDALRASEQRYRSIFETVREGVLLLDAGSGVILDTNPFFVHLVGFGREELVGRTPWDVGLFEDSATARRRLGASSAGSLGFDPDVTLRTKQGLTARVEAIISAYMLGGRLVTQVNLRDITERSKLAEQVRQMQKLDSVGRLAGGVAHDFNNLLNIISAHLSFLSRENLPPEKRIESSRSIELAVARGTAVVRQLLTFARKTDVSIEATDVNGVVKELASMLSETLPKQIRVLLKLTDDLPRIQADPNQLHQALLNLAVNARDAMEQGGTLVIGTSVVSGATLRAKFPEAGAAHYVELCVADTGTGMDGDTRRRIFEPFFTTKGARGQGLGLAVVYGIVNGHKGWVDVESETGKGTTFRVYFEAPEAVSAEEQPRRRKGRARGRASPRNGKGRTLLIVEDEETLLNPVRALLEEKGFEVLAATDGLQAVERHAEHVDRIAAVILDLSLPRLGGWQAFLRMRQRDPHLRCIVVSGNLDPAERAEMRRAGVQASIRKPYTSDEILRVVDEVLA